LKEIILVSPKLGIGGIQRALTNLANWFASNEYQVTLISCKKEPLFYPLDPKVNLITPQKAHPGSQGNIIFHYIRIIFFLRNAFKANSSQHIISFGDVFNPLTLIASIGLKKKVHISDRTSPDFKFKWYISFLKKLTYPYSTTFIAQTTKAAIWNVEKFANKLNIKVIPNPIREVNVDTKISKEKILLYVGRFAWEKNPEALIRAFFMIENKEGWKLVMLGDGPLLPAMKSLALQLQLVENIQFVGQVKDVDSYFSKASLYVLPSILEGFPNALCEAMAAGLPCVCVEGIPYEDLGAKELDFLVAKQDDIFDLSTKINHLLQSESLRMTMGKNAQSIKERLALPIIFTKFEEILN